MSRVKLLGKKPITAGSPLTNVGSSRIRSLGEKPTALSSTISPEHKTTLDKYMKKVVGGLEQKRIQDEMFKSGQASFADKPIVIPQRGKEKTPFQKIITEPIKEKMKEPFHAIVNFLKRPLKPIDKKEDIGLWKRFKKEESVFKIDVGEGKYLKEWLAEDRVKMPTTASQKLQSAIVTATSPQMQQTLTDPKTTALLGKSIIAKSITATTEYKNISIVEEKFGDKFLDKTEKEIYDLALETPELANFIDSMGFSLSTMAPAIATGVGVAALPIPGARPAGRIIGGGVMAKMAYNMTVYSLTTEYLKMRNAEQIKDTGKGITLEEEKKIKEDFYKNAHDAGLWEAVPEVIGGMIGFSVLAKPLTKMFGKNFATQLLSKVGAVYAPEVATEAITELAQTKIRHNVGLPNGKDIDWTSPEDWKSALATVAPMTAAITLVTGGAVSIGMKINVLKQELGTDNKSLFDNFAIKIKELSEQIKKSEEGFARIPGVRVPLMGKKETAPISDDLATQAKKFDSAEEFIKKSKNIIHRGDVTSIPFEKLDTIKVFDPSKTEAIGAFNNTPGLYFTTSLKNAKSYGENITSVAIKDTANILDIDDAIKTINRNDIEKIIRSNPDIKDEVLNYSENFEDGINKIVDSVMDEKDGNEFLKAIWADGGFSNKNFPIAMKNFGIDGLKIKKDDVIHYVVYNKDVLQTKSQLTEIYNKAKAVKEVKPEVRKRKVKTGKEQLAEREQIKQDIEQAKIKKETLQFFDSELESQYANFKKLKVKDVEDTAQLKAKNKNVAVNEIDNMLYSQEKTGDEVFDMFADRYAKEKEALPMMPKETKAVVAEKVRQKEKITAKDKRQSILDKIKMQKDTVQAIKQDIVNYAKQYLDLEERGKLLDTIKNVETFKDLDKAKLYIEKLSKKAFKRKIVEQIDKELRNIKLVKKGTMKVSRYDYETNKFLQNLKDINKYTQKKAQAELVNIKTENLTNADLIKNRLLSLKANGMKSSLALQAQVLADIQDLKSIGEETKDELAFQKKLEKQEKKDEILKGIQNQKKSKVILKQLKSSYLSSVSNLYSTINAIAGKNIADKYDYGRFQTNSKQDFFMKTEELKNKAKEIYGVKNDRQLTKIFISDLAKKDYKITDIEGLSEDLSKFDLLNIYNGIKNDLIEERYYNFFGEEQVTSLLQNLTPEDAQLADYLMEEVQSYKDILNERSIEIKGVDNGTVENYWPSVSEYMPEFFDDIKIQGEMPSATKERSKSSRVIPRMANAWLLSQKHIAEAEHVKTVSRKYEELKNLFADRTIRKTIETKYGDDAYKSLMKHIETFSLNYRTEGLDIVSGIYSKALNNWVKAKIASPTVFARQMISVIYSIEKVGIKNFAKYQKEFIINPEKAFKYMWDNIPFIRNRFKMGYSEAVEDIIRGTKTMNIGMGSITKYTTLMTRGGDITAIMLNGYPIIKSEMAKHGNMEKAIKVFQKFSEKTQQSPVNANLSDLQRNKGAWHKTFFRFKNTTNQLLRLQVDANIQFINKQISSKDYATKTLLYSVYTPIMYVLVGYAITQGWKALFGTDDEEKTESLLGDFLQNIIVQPFQALPFLDMVTEATYQKIRQKITGKSYNYGMFSYPLFDDIETAWSKLFKKEPSGMDLLEVLSLVQEPATGVPTGTVLRYFKYTIDPEKKTPSIRTRKKTPRVRRKRRN